MYLPPERREPTGIRDLQKLEDIAVALISEYADRFWRSRRSRWESQHLEVRILDQSDPNCLEEHQISFDAQDQSLLESVRAVSECLREGPIGDLRLGLLVRDQQVYKPLLYAVGKDEPLVKVRPVHLSNDEKRVVESLADLAQADSPCLQGRELFLIRNLSRGRGVSFFDEHAYYPDFIVWLIKGNDQHVLFLDPKGLIRFGPREGRKVRLHTRIKDIESRLRQKDPGLRLHAYVLSVTPPEEIGEIQRTQTDWERKGVYFLKDPTWAERLIVDALKTPPP